MIGIPGLSIPRRRRAAASYPLLNNLVAYWNLDEASGQRNDSHTSGLHLTDNNTVTSATGPDGGTAASFAAASSEYLSRASSSAFDLATGNFCAAGWLYLTTKSTVELDALSIVIGRDNTTATRDWRLGYSNFGGSNAFGFSVSNGSSVAAVQTAGASTGQWYFVVGWRDGASIYLQVDGGSVASQALAITPANSSNPLQIGRVLPFYSNGRHAFVGLWSRILTAAERTWLYNSGAGRNYAAVAAYTG